MRTDCGFRLLGMSEVQLVCVSWIWGKVITSEQEEHLHMISVAAVSAVTGAHVGTSFDFSVSGMIDAGDNVSMGPPEVATTLGETVHAY